MQINPNLSRLLGHLFFDGAVGIRKNGGHWFNYSNSSLESINNFVNLVISIFNLKRPKIRRYIGENGNYYQVTFYSKKIVKELLKISPTYSTSKNIGVPKSILNGSMGVKKQFLKSFWDDEGCITSDRLRIHGALLSERMIDGLVRLHKDLGINVSKWKNSSNHSRVIYILSFKENIKRFSKLIGFEYSLITKGKSKGAYKKELLIKKLNKMGLEGFEPSILR